MKIYTSLFVTIRPFKAVAVWGGRNKREAYKLVKEASKNICTIFSKKSKFYYISPVMLEVNNKDCPDVTFYTPVLERHPAVLFIQSKFNVSVDNLMHNIVLLNQYRYLGKINYIDEYVHLRLYNLRREFGIMKRYLFCNKHYRKKEKELNILLVLNSYFKNWLLVQLIHSFLPPYTEIFDLDLSIVRT